MDEDTFGRVVDHWERVIDDMAATAEEARNAGTETIELHPGDVTTLTPASRSPDYAQSVGAGEDLGGQSPEGQSPEGSEEYGFDVIVPGEEFERLRDLVAEHGFDSYEVFRAEASGVVFAVVALESSDGAAAVFVPTYYEVADVSDLREAAREQGELYTRVRTLSGEEVVTFTHDDPAPFFPEPGTGGEETSR